MEEYCAKHANNPTESHLAYLSNFIVSEKYKIVFCPVPKVSCTVWKKLLAKLEGVNIVKNVHEEIKYKLKSLKKYSLKVRQNILNTYTKFMFVREPFERLLSAYRDVFLGWYKRKDAFWRRYRRRVRDYLVRHGRFDIDLNADNTTFEEFVSYVILTWKNGEKLQVHWGKMIDICHPCYIQFDFIGHYENLVEDATFILRKAKLSDKVQFPGWRPTATNTLIENYYSNLTFKEIIQLKKIYNDDIEQFGYTFPGLLQPVIKNYDNYSYQN